MRDAENESHDLIRDRLWNATYYTYYNVYWYEKISDNVVKRWSNLNDFIKVLIATTASSSAISGLAFWTTEYGKGIWIGLVAFAGFMSIVNLALKIENKIKDWTDIKNNWINLRFKLEIFKDRMIFNPDFKIDEYQNEFIKLKDSYGEISKQLKPDYFIRKRLIEKTQKTVNFYIENYNN